MAGCNVYGKLEAPATSRSSRSETRKSFFADKPTPHWGGVGGFGNKDVVTKGVLTPTFSIQNP